MERTNQVSRVVIMLAVLCACNLYVGATREAKFWTETSNELGSKSPTSNMHVKDAGYNELMEKKDVQYRGRQPGMGSGGFGVGSAGYGPGSGPGSAFGDSSGGIYGPVSGKGGGFGGKGSGPGQDGSYIPGGGFGSGPSGAGSNWGGPGRGSGSNPGSGYGYGGGNGPHDANGNH